MKFFTLASGSSGNSLYIESEHSKILVDAGISFRRISRALKERGIRVADLDAVVLSHEHEDHSRAVGMMDGVPVYVSSETVGHWKQRESRRNGAIKKMEEFDSATAFSINDLTVTPFSVAHDAIDPVGFSVSDGSAKIGVITDAGKPTALMVESVRDCDALVIESNHDRQMLFLSSYPAHLKQRISGGHGHLSNEQTAQVLDSVVHPGLKHVLLAHLSEKNNMPQLALARSLEALRRNGAEGRTTLAVAPRTTAGEVMTV